MKNNKFLKVLITVLLIVAGLLSTTLVIDNNRIRVEAANYTVENRSLKSITVTKFQIKNVSLGIPNTDTIFDIYEDSATGFLSELGYNRNTNEYELFLSKSGTKSQIKVSLKKRSMDLIAGGKILSDSHNFYVGIENSLFVIDKTSLKVKRIDLPKEKFLIDRKLVPNKVFLKNNYIIDIALLKDEIAISRNCSTAILFYNMANGKFNEIKLPESFGSINKLLALKDKGILFVTNFYSGKKNFLIKNKFACYDLKTKKFLIFGLPVDYLFLYNDTVYGVSPTDGIIKLDKSLKKIEATNITPLNVLTPFVPSKNGLWFVGTDAKINYHPDDILPVNNTVYYYSDNIKKPIEYIGLYSPEDGTVKKHYMPLLKTNYDYGGFTTKTNKPNSKERKGFQLITEIVPGKNGSAILFKGFGKAIVVSP